MRSALKTIIALFILVSPVLAGTAAADQFITLGASQDAYVDQASPGVNYGSGTSLLIDAGGGSPVRAIMSFNMTMIPNGAEITGATLQLYGEWAAGDNGTSIHWVGDYDWDEETVTWDSISPCLPDPGAEPLATAEVQGGQWNSWELDPTHWPCGTDLQENRVTLALYSAEAGGEAAASFSSSETGGGAPVMVVTWRATAYADLYIVPFSGVLPFNSSIGVTLINYHETLTRRIAARLKLVTAGGQVFDPFRQGFTTLQPEHSRAISWSQYFPALGTLVGENVFTLEAMDVTPPPYNQPPFPPSGDTDTSVWTVTGFAP